MDYTRDFHYGTSGSDVRAFQTNLLKLGYELPKYGSDGIYGKETESAAKDCCTDAHWDYCSWGIENGEPPCPVWLQERVEKTANGTPTPEVWVPEGRGMWIQSMNTIDGAAEVETIVSHVGLKFVIIQAHWQYTDKPSYQYNWPDDMGLTKRYGGTENAREAIEKFQEMGVEVLPFSYPVPGKHQEVIDLLGRYKEAWGSPSVVIDPEVEWKSTSDAHVGDANELAAMLSEAFESWGMSSYGAPWYHRSFPFAAFNPADYGLPQTYSTAPFGTVEKMTRAMDEWRAYGYLYLVNLYGTYSKTDEEMRAYLEVVKAMSPVATAGWKWGATSDPEWDYIDNILPG
jgi:hypothetical protein